MESNVQSYGESTAVGTLKQGNLIFLSCETDSDDWDAWKPVNPEDVPEMLTQPDILGRIVLGYSAQVDGSHIWYRALTAD